MRESGSKTAAWTRPSEVIKANILMCELKQKEIPISPCSICSLWHTFFSAVALSCLCSGYFAMVSNIKKNKTNG